MEDKFIQGFSKLSKEQKLKIISDRLVDDTDFLTELNSLNHRNPEVQLMLEQFSENTLGNFPLPYGVAPNFLINGRYFTVPMVTEESSVVAAAASAARFWSEKGGFHASVKNTTKVGQIHFCLHGESAALINSLDELKVYLEENSRHLTRKMTERGGGLREIELIDLTEFLDNYYQLRIGFETADSMGANFINSVLEEMSSLMKIFFSRISESGVEKEDLEIIMSILSNYTPDCVVECFIEAPFSSLSTIHEGFSGEEFARRFKLAVDIASVDPFRAVTHNKGIFNGIDAVVLATANDFRAVEAAGHAYASRSGKYRSLSRVELRDDVFRMSLKLPIAVGTVGGLTSLHPLAKWSFEILGKPDARELMMIIASAGLASNFAAIRSLITHGIQKGHMKMHLGNILSVLGASAEERATALGYFENHTVSYRDVEQFLNKQRGGQ